MSGGKGGSQTSKVEIPAFIQEPARRNIQRAEQLAQVGYMPYYGPSVAAFSPMQTQAMQSTADAAAAFGLAPQMDVMASMPQPQDFGGMQGYGTGQIFEQALSELAAQQPAQTQAFNRLFVGPRPEGLLAPTGPMGGYLPMQFGNPVMGGPMNSTPSLRGGAR
jgi:hypothetical protein